MSAAPKRVMTREDFETALIEYGAITDPHEVFELVQSISAHDTALRAALLSALREQVAALTIENARLREVIERAGDRFVAINNYAESRDEAATMAGEAAQWLGERLANQPEPEIEL